MGQLDKSTVGIANTQTQTALSRHIRLVDFGVTDGEGHAMCSHYDKNFFGVIKNRSLSKRYTKKV